MIESDPDFTPRPSWWRRRNWWKIGFFVLLVLFEFTREIAVLASNEPPKIATMAYVGSVGGYYRATGRWTRVDGGSPLVPSATLIQCARDRQECVETTASFFNGYLGAPESDTFKATFTDEAVNYENDDPTCARYSVRIDLKLEKVFALRERKANPANKNCTMLERRIEMTLGDGYQHQNDRMGDHWVPLVRLFVGALNLFN